MRLGQLIRVGGLALAVLAGGAAGCEDDEDSPKDASGDTSKDTGGGSDAKLDTGTTADSATHDTGGGSDAGTTDTATTEGGSEAGAEAGADAADATAG